LPSSLRCNATKEEEEGDSTVVVAFFFLLWSCSAVAFFVALQRKTTQRYKTRFVTL